MKIQPTKFDVNDELVQYLHKQQGLAEVITDSLAAIRANIEHLHHTKQIDGAVYNYIKNHLKTIKRSVA